LEQPLGDERTCEDPDVLLDSVADEVELLGPFA
jgi:hypothetical protein